MTRSAIGPRTDAFVRKPPPSAQLARQQCAVERIQDGRRDIEFSAVATDRAKLFAELRRFAALKVAMH